MATSAQLESAWATITGANQPEWVDGIQMATGIYVRYTVADSKLYQWSAAGGTWAQVTNLSTFLAPGAVSLLGGPHTAPLM